MAKARIRVVMQLLPGGEYLATSPDLPGLVAEGQTKEETLQIAMDLAQKITESCLEHGDPLPPALASPGWETTTELEKPPEVWKLTGFNYSAVARKLRTFGFDLERQVAGIHEIWRNRNNGREITIPHHANSIAEGTLRAILREAGIDVEEFLKA
jgi:predicted RNase H-like HicB family nuclease/predicted RNA binding protein YcfA (HicA-like mRNA interferase family)